MAILMLIIGFPLLLIGAELLIRGATQLASRLGISELLIGLTIVAFGTSAPEFFVSVSAALTGRPQIAASNVLGSNIFNILVILAAAALIRPIKVTISTVAREIPFCLLAAFLLLLLANDSFFDPSTPASLSRTEGITLLAFFAIFLAYLIAVALKKPANPQAQSAQPARRQASTAFIAMSIIAGLALLPIASNLIVTGASRLAAALGVSDRIIGLTIVSAGTSLPELAASITAARKNSPDLAVGNVVGSNIFNTFFILASALVVRPIAYYPGLNLDLTVSAVAALLLFIFMFTFKKLSLDRIEAVVMLLIYVAYLTLLIAR